MGKSLSELAYDLIANNSFLVPKSILSARKWDPKEVPKISAELLIIWASIGHYLNTYTPARLYLPLSRRESNQIYRA